MALMSGLRPSKPFIPPIKLNRRNSMRVSVSVSVSVNPRDLCPEPSLKFQGASVKPAPLRLRR